MIGLQEQAPTQNRSGLRRYVDLPNFSALTKHNIQTLFVMCVALSAALRLLQLGAQNFWFDEVETLRYAYDLFPVRDIHPPTYYGLIHLVLLFGNSEFWVRMPSLLMGVASVAMVYYVGRLLFEPRITLIATLLAAISPILVWHSQDARMYSQFLLACLITVFFYLQIIRQGKTIYWVGYLFGALFAAYTQLYAAFLVIALSCHLLLFYRPLLLRWITFQFLLLLGYVPWLIIFFNLPPEQIGGVRPKTLVTFPYTYYAFTNGYSLGPTIRELRDFSLSVLIPYLPIIIPIALVVTLLAVFGLRSLWRSSRDQCSFIVLWAVLPVLMAVMVPIIVRSMTYNVRYVIFSVPPFLYILAQGVVFLRRYYIGVVLLLIVVVFNSWSLYNNYFDARYAKEDVRGAAQFVAANASPDDHVLVITVDHIFEWYFHQANPVMSNSSSESARSLVDEAIAGAHTLWLVESRVWQSDPNNEIRKLLDNQYSLISKNEFSGVTLYRYCILDCSSS